MPDQTSFPLIFALWGAGLGAAGQYAKMSVIFDRLPSAYPDAGTALGFIVSLVGFVGIVFGVVAGLVVARIRYRRALLWALWAGAALSLFQSLLPPLPWMLLARGVEGLSHLAVVVAAPTLIAQLSASRHRGLTLSLWSTFFGVAFTLLVALGLPLVASQGLASLFVAHAIWMASFAMILSLALDRSEEARPEPLPLRHILETHVKIYRSPHIGAPGLGWFFYTFCFLAILTVVPPFIAPEWRAWTLASMPLVSIFVSMTLGVVAMRVLSAVQVVQIGFLLCVSMLIWLLLVPGSPTACLALAAALGLIQGASFAAVPQLNEMAPEQAQANGAMAQMGNLGNTLGTPAMLFVVSMAGYSGLILISGVIFLAGFGIHAWMSVRRRY